MFLAEGILILEFWLFVLTSDLRGFLFLVFALATKVGAVSVHLLSWVSALFYFGESMAFNDLRSVGGFQVASGWLMQTPLGLFVLTSGWLPRSQWVACT